MGTIFCYYYVLQITSGFRAIWPTRWPPEVENLKITFFSDIMFEIGAHYPTEPKNIHFLPVRQFSRSQRGQRSKRSKPKVELFFKIFTLILIDFGSLSPNMTFVLLYD